MDGGAQKRGLGDEKREKKKEKNNLNFFLNFGLHYFYFI